MVRLIKAVSLGIGLALAAAPNARAQDQLAHVRDLYSNAAYEELLSTLAEDADVPPPQVGQYKVFSLIALGRAKEAEKAAEAVIIANPRFQPDRDASPRVLELFATVRKRVVPDLLKSMYVNGKAALDKKDRDGAIREFSEVVEVAQDADLQANSVVGELRLLASGFLDLSRALPAAAPPARAESEKKDAAAAPPPESAPATKNSGPKVTLPIPIVEKMPTWTPPDAFAARTTFHGRILVRIDEDGRVVSSELVTPTTVPFFDKQLLSASRQWRYKPAVVNGMAVASERIVDVVLQPK